MMTVMVTMMVTHTRLDVPAVPLVFVPPRSLGTDLFKTLETPRT